MVTINENNHLHITGNVVRLNKYNNNKCCNITVAAQVNDEEATYIGLKCFNKDVFEPLVVGSLVSIIGHVGDGSYINSEGVRVFKDNNDLVADHIKYLETKADRDYRQKRNEYAEKYKN